MHSALRRPGGRRPAIFDDSTGRAPAIVSEIPTPPEDPVPIGAPTSPQEEPLRRLRDFQVRLHELTPKVWGTQAILAINVGVFGVMVFSGVHPFLPTTESLIAWGANYGPATLAGQWWRLLSCAFVHIGLLHVAFNMWALWSVGQMVERLVGNLGFLALYVISGLAGSTASVAWNPSVVSAGASGAVFGVFGALLGFILWQRDAVPPAVFRDLRNSTVACLAYNIFFGMSVKGIDNAAHLGGLAAGFLCGLVLSQRLEQATAGSRLIRNLLVSVAGGAAILAAIHFAPKAPADVFALVNEFKTFSAMERELITAYNAAVQQCNNGQMQPAAFADMIQRDILPRWREQRARLERYQDLPADLAQTHAKLLRYMALRDESWDLRVEAIRDNNRSKADQADRTAREADALAKEL